ncbi:succinate dehydrogenase cytochrome b560 subunit [Halyomorpha halys]|uniref:succinate dehydrogenase cytochrome b560 subunit n=1 Tax=Halyomorpha halys TaxID=286706 RepID=UPI0006D4F663|nr:succinate dehydrogenase cytochrome b560 subunit-like [Halyomorpha halys]
MSILRSTCVLGRFMMDMRSHSLPKIWSTQIRVVNMKVSKAEPPENYTYEERNILAGRPLAPYLTVYAPQLTSMMSISHRFTGMILSGYAFLLASTSFFISDMAEFACKIGSYGIPSFIIFFFKLMFGFPAVYHLCNGIRHLVWDMGKALELKQVYLGGYITLAVAAILTLLVAM